MNINFLLNFENGLLYEYILFIVNSFDFFSFYFKYLGDGSSFKDFNVFV